MLYIVGYSVWLTIHQCVRIEIPQMLIFDFFPFSSFEIFGFAVEYGVLICIWWVCATLMHLINIFLVLSIWAIRNGVKIRILSAIGSSFVIKWSIKVRFPNLINFTIEIRLLSDNLPLFWFGIRFLLQLRLKI